MARQQNSNPQSTPPPAATTPPAPPAPPAGDPNPNPTPDENLTDDGSGQGDPDPEQEQQDPPAPPAPPAPVEESTPSRDCPDTSKALRKLVDLRYGKGYTVLSVGKTQAYIQDARRGFKINISTGDLIG